MNISTKRIIKDIKTLNESNLEESGIYFNTTDNLYNIQVLMIGNDNTPYNYGYYLFDITFPENYPFEPPHVKYCTQGDNIRFNPNLYVNGKVCLSLLNTWNGPQWTSCNSILSILLSIKSTIFIENPLINEPGFENDNSINSINYSKIVQYGNYKIAILKILQKIPRKFNCFKEIIENTFKKNFENIIKCINEITLKNNNNKINIISNIYRMKCYIDYDFIVEQLHEYYNNLE